MTQKRFSGFPATIITDDGGRTAKNFRQIHSVSVNPGTSVSELVVQGDTDRTNVTTVSAAPTIEFSTRDLLTALTEISGLVGLCAKDPDTPTATSAFFRWQERADCGTFTALATAQHVGWYAQGGLICPGTLSASQGDESGASLSCRLTVTSTDGHTDPLTHVDAVDLSTGDTTTPAFVSRFFLGPVTVGGALVEGISEVSVDYGHEVMAKAFDGDVFPRVVTIDRRMPKITFTTAKGDAAANLSVFGRSSGAVSCYFIKGANYSTRVALGTAEHVSVSAAAGMWMHDSASVTDNGDGTISFSVIPTGTLSTSLTATIPTS